MSILEDLYYGNIAPYKHECKSPHIEQIQELTTRNDTRLTAVLSAEQQDIYDRFKVCIYEENDLLQLQSFKEGFRLGMRMAFESMCEMEVSTNA